jgi:hypothetical protein
VPAGFGVYLLLNWKISAEPFAFLRSRKALFDISAAWPWVGVRGNITHLDWRSPAEAEMIGTQELYFTALGLICVVAAWLKLRPAYTVWMTGSWLPVVSATFIEKHAALYADNVPYLYSVCPAGRASPLECAHHDLVSAIPCPIRQPLCSRLVGVLNHEWTTNDSYRLVLMRG